MVRHFSVLQFPSIDFPVRHSLLILHFQATPGVILQELARTSVVV